MIDFQTINDQAKLYFDKKQFDKALGLLERPDLPKELLGNLAKCYYYTKQAHKAIKILDSIPKNEESWIDMALYYNAIGDSDKSYNIYKNLNSNNSKVKFNLGYHLLERNQFLDGFQHLQHGSEHRVWGSEYLLLEQNTISLNKKWDGRPTKHLALILEGGLGDEIIFLRWAEYLKTLCETLTIYCNVSLLRLLCNSNYSVQPHSNLKHSSYDYYVPSMSIPAICRINSPQENVIFPYINSFKERFIEEQLNQIAKGRKKIGIKWFGNPEFEHDQFRTVPSNALKGLSQFGQVFSLQFEDNDPNIPNCKEIIKDWQDTYSVFSSLDLLVTSCTSTAHLAGAMGIQVIVLVPLVPYFVWASDTMPWYPKNVKILRQTKYNDWSETVKELYHEISRI